MSVTALERLEPAPVWRHFLQLTRIPRPSKQEDEAREYVLSWAKEHGFDAGTDDVGNAVVRVPGSAGREAQPVVVLQAHLDMVCERDPESPYDPREGRINVVLDGDWVAADGTTLGADNGIGVAAALAAAEDATIPHGPLELLFTVSEEQGLDGAKALDPGLVTGRMLLNLDGTSDEALTIGCAGSVHTFTRLPLAFGSTSASHAALEVTVHGARGGHSGGDIARGRINANKALGRILSHVLERVQFRLSLLEGGVSRNAIPREARAVVALPSEAADTFHKVAREELAAVGKQYEGSDELELTITAQGPVGSAASEPMTARALDLLAALPTGVLAMSPDVPDTVETSTSLNVVSTDGDVVTFASMTRSANAVALDDVVSGIEAPARLAGAEVEVVRSYPPWRPNPKSRLLATARAAFERVTGSEPSLEVVHGGLECAVIAGKLPGIDMLSIGPEIVGPHAPGERLSVPGTERFYRLLGALLDDLSRV